MPATIKDIARETGLSLSTISKYLNNKNIQEKNRVLIEAAIRRLDYRPNRVAQSLRAERTRTVAILLTDLGNYFWGDVIFSITHYFAQKNYTVIACSYNYDTDLEKEMAQYLVAKKVDGVILLPINKEDITYKFLQEANIPVVLLDQYPSSMKEYPVDVVSSDNTGVGKKIADYLIAKGHRRIGILSPAEHFSTIRERVLGFQEGCSEFEGISLCSSEFVELNGEHSEIMKKGKKCFREIMGHPDPPTAIFCTNYMIAMGVLLEAVEQNYSIPEDISIIGYDDDLLFRSMSPPITCVAQDLKTIGIKASEILLKRINGDAENFPMVKIVEVSFCERESVCNLSKSSD